MTVPRDRLLMGALLIVLASACFAVVSMFVQLASAHAHQVVIVFAMFAIGWVVLVPIALSQGRQFLATQYPVMMTIRSFTGVLQMGTLFFALKTISLVEANLMREAAPLWVPILLWLIWREKMPAKLWFGIVTGFIGMALVLHPGIIHFAVGYLFALVNGILFGLQSILSRRLGEAGEPPLKITCYVFTAGTFSTAIPAAMYWQPMPIETWLYLGAIGGLMLCSTMLLLSGFRRAPAYVLAPFGYAAVVFSALLDWAVFDRALGVLTLVGIVLVVAAGLLIVRLSQDSRNDGHA